MPSGLRELAYEAEHRLAEIFLHHVYLGLSPALSYFSVLPETLGCVPAVPTAKPCQGRRDTGRDTQMGQIDSFSTSLCDSSFLFLGQRR